MTETKPTISNETEIRGKRRRWFSNLILLGVTIAIMAFMGEIALRWLLADQIVMFPRYHTDVVYGDFRIRRLRPNTTFWHRSVDGDWQFIINSQGFRSDRDFSYEKPIGKVRIVTLGDSNTQGFEARQDETFSAVIERTLKKQGINAETINMGISGFGTAEQLVLLENEAIKYHPDVVVLGFYENDFEDNIKAGLFSLEKEELTVQKRQHIPGVKIINLVNGIGLFRWLSENSYFYSFFLNTAWNFAKQMLATREQVRLQTEYTIATEQVDDYKIALTSALIERMYEFCRRQGVRLVVLDIPRPSEPRKVRTSVPAKLLDTMRKNSDAFVYSPDLLDRYADVAELHTPHGFRHISEFTHLVLGMEASKRISDILLARQQ